MALKPVLGWIHGGGHVDGETADYDASKQATGGPLGTPTVVVTINYRLGLFGFLSESHLNSENGNGKWGNYGILDQQAALRWVMAFIAPSAETPQVALGDSCSAQDTGAKCFLQEPQALNRASTKLALVLNGTAATRLQGSAFDAPLGIETLPVCVTSRPRGSCRSREHPMLTPSIQTSIRLT